MPRFDEWFKRATEHTPYPVQVRFACEPGLLSNPSPSGPLWERPVLSEAEGSG